MSFSDHEVHGLIHELHRAMKYETPPYSISNLMESLFPEVDVVGRNMEAHASIEAYRQPLPGGIRAVIAYSENDHHSTQRFSIGHELGHWLFDLRRGEQLDVPPCMRGGRRNAAERRADYFAAELLAPLWIVDRLVDFEIHPPSDDEDAVARRNQKIQRLASRFNVSTKCMKNRVLSLYHWRKIYR